MFSMISGTTESRASFSSHAIVILASFASNATALAITLPVVIFCIAPCTADVQATQPSPSRESMTSVSGPADVAAAFDATTAAVAALSTDDLRLFLHSVISGKSDKKTAVIVEMTMLGK